MLWISSESEGKGRTETVVRESPFVDKRFPYRQIGMKNTDNNKAGFQ